MVVVVVGVSGWRGGGSRCDSRIPHCLRLASSSSLSPWDMAFSSSPYSPLARRYAFVCAGTGTPPPPPPPPLPLRPPLLPPPLPFPWKEGGRSGYTDVSLVRRIGNTSEKGALLPKKPDAPPPCCRAHGAAPPSAPSPLPGPASLLLLPPPPPRRWRWRWRRRRHLLSSNRGIPMST